MQNRFFKRHRLSRASDLIEIEDTVEIVESVLVKLTGAHSGDIRVSLPSWKTKLVMKEGKPWEEEGMEMAQKSMIRTQWLSSSENAPRKTSR